MGLLKKTVQRSAGFLKWAFLLLHKLREEHM
jgi:hypothetical protein